MHLNRRVFVWAPRLLGIATALFLGIFALDAIGGPALALLIHLAPAAMVAGVVAMAWRNELVGSLGFLALGVAYIALAWGRFPWTVYAAISGPLFLTAILFAISWTVRRPAPGAASTG